MEKNEKNWGSIKYPKKSLAALFFLLILAIPGYERIVGELKTMIISRDQGLSFSYASTLLSPFMAAAIIFLFAILIVIIIKNDGLKEGSKELMSWEGLIDLIRFTFLCMFLFGFFGIIFTLVDRNISKNYFIGSFVGFGIGMLAALAAFPNEFKKEKKES